MQFVHQPLVWGFLLVLLPLLIHLINMLRHRRVKWAAMEFLLKSYKKHRKWVWLKQLLLLLARMAAVAVIVGMLAQWITQGQWLDLMGGKTTHHLVLVDDSYSMSDQKGSGTAFQTALDVVRQVAGNAAAQDTRQKFTLVRFSRAAMALADPTTTDGGAGSPTVPPNSPPDGAPGGNVDAPGSGDSPAGDSSDDEDRTPRLSQVADMNAETVTSDFDLQLEERRNDLQVTQLAAGPRPALELVRQLLNEESDDAHVVYVVSDFRNKEWGSPTELQPVLRDLEKAGAQIRLIDCVRTERPNLAIVDLKPTDDTRAAGVPLFVNIDVKNFGSQPARKVQLQVRSFAYPASRSGTDLESQLQGTEEELPTVFIENIDPGAVVSRRVQVYFGEPGQHVVEATLPDDAVPFDNRRWCVVDFPEGEPVLVVDGSLEQKSAYFLTSTFQPGQRANTGIRPDVKDPAFLRDTSVADLGKYTAIYLMDVGRLDDRAVDNLEAYVKGGGGLAVFVGDNVNHAFYNERLFRSGTGLMPVELGGDQLLPPSLEEGAADIEVTDHPIFSIFLGESNPLIRRVRVERYLEPPADWLPDPNSTVRVLAQLRNGAPLAVESTFGAGRVVCLLTSLSPEWNNWAQDPSFVVMLLKLQSYLASANRPMEDRLVASPLKVQLDPEQFSPEVKFFAPDEGFGDRVEVTTEAKPPQPNATVLVATLGGTATGIDRDATGRSGIYEAVLTRKDDNLEIRRFAANVDPAEGDLAIQESRELLEKLEPLKLEFHHADDYQYGDLNQDGFNRSLMLMALLICLLLGEQILAYVASYHPARGAAR